MTENDAELIEKITSHESDIVGIYAKVYPVLKTANPAMLPNDMVAELSRLDPPDKIEPSKAVAIVKAMRGSTPNDKFHLENCYRINMPNGNSVSGFVGDHLKELGIAYHDFWPYLRKSGWLNE